MKITKLTASNFMGLRAVEINPDGSVVTISGANEAGKSSVLNAICAGLGAKLPDIPIREGETNAEITIVLDKYKVTKSLTRTTGGGYSHRLQVEDANGGTVKKPQTFLNELLGALTFDPFKFSNMRDDERRDILIEMTGLDLSKIEAERTALYDDRTQVGRDQKAAEGAAKMTEPLDADSIPDKAIDVAALSGEKDRINDLLWDYEGAEEKLLDAKVAATKAEADIKALQKSLDQYNEKIKEYEKIITDDKERMGKHRERLIKINDEIETSTQANEKIQDKKTWITAMVRAQAYADKYKVLSSGIKALDTAKEKAVKAATMPVKGLSFSEDGVILDGIPFGQLSKSRRIRASIEIGMKMNPEIRILMIEDGSLLDNDSMKIVQEMAEKHDFQIWIEVVDETGTVGIYIEDGAVVEAA